MSEPTVPAPAPPAAANPALLPAAGSGAVDHPRHYNAHPSGVECIVVAEAFGFNLGNVIKYVWRAEEKGAPIEDLKKARWYLDREIARRESLNAPAFATGSQEEEQ